MPLAWLDKKHARRGWGLLITAGLGFAVLLGLDYEFLALKSDAYILPDTDWTLSSGDLPGAWTSFEHSPLFARIATQAPEVYPRIESWMRRETGMRWTPARWNLWFGRTIFVSSRHSEYAISVDAKPIARLALLAGRFAGVVHDRDGLMQISNLYAKWSGSFLLLGTTPEMVAALQAAGEQRSAVGGPILAFSSNKNVGIDASMNAQGEIESGIWLSDISRRDVARPDYFAMEWPAQPIVSVRARGLDFSEDSLIDSWPEFPGSEELKKAWGDFETLLPAEWRKGADTTQFALFGVDTSETIPVPDAAIYARSETPLSPLLPPAKAIPYEWSGNAGWMAPWMGEGANLFVVANAHARVFANQESTMAKLMARERSGRIASQDAVIDVDAPGVAAVLRNLARRVAKNELWPERNADDIERDVIPWMNAFEALGEIHLEGNYENGGLVLRGGTHPPASAGATK